MGNTYAIIANGLVVNIACADHPLEKSWVEAGGAVGIGWEYDGVNFIEPVPEPEPAPTQAEQEAKRQAAYQSEADPLFFQWQAGEGTEAGWLAKRQEIRDRYPYPSE
jgi:hypothetical protein